MEVRKMKIVIINGSARKENTLTAINALMKGASAGNSGTGENRRKYMST